MEGIYGVKNTTLNCLVTDGSRQPLVFGTKQAASRWFRLNGYPKGLILVNTQKGVTAEERKSLLKTWVGRNRN